MLAVGRRVIPAVLHYIAHTGSRELFRLAVLSVALGVAFAAAYLFGVSIALGAFFAGMILSGSPLSQRAAEESLPLRDAFAVLFFVSVGMLFNPRVVIEQPLALALTFAIVLAGGAAAFVLLRLFGVKTSSALTIAVSLTQIGEFSFILADLGIGLGVLTEKARDLILGASILSIFLNPLLFALAARREASPRAKPEPDSPKPAPEPTGLSDHAVLVGYGRVGQPDRRQPERRHAAAGDRGRRRGRGGHRASPRQCRHRGGAGRRQPRRRGGFSMSPSRKRSKRARSWSRRGGPIPAWSSWRGPISTPRPSISPALAPTRW